MFGTSEVTATSLFLYFGCSCTAQDGSDKCPFNCKQVSSAQRFIYLQKHGLDVAYGDLEYYHLNELYSMDCNFISTPRLTGRGGGLAVVLKRRFICQSVSTDTYPSLELQMIKVGRSNSFYCILVYRPPGPAPSFLIDFLSSIIKLDRVIIVGDFNIHVDDDTCTNASEFVNITESFNFTQHIFGPTHNK